MSIKFKIKTEWELLIWYCSMNGLNTGSGSLIPSQLLMKLFAKKVSISIVYIPALISPLNLGYRISRNRNGMK